MNDLQIAADKAMIQRVATGDEQALSELYDRLHAPLFSLIVKMIGDLAEAEDVLQEVFLQIWKRANSYDAAQSSVFSWTVMLARSRSIDRLRSRGRRNRILASTTEEEGHDVASESETAADTAEKSDERARARTALMALPQEQRQAIEMAFFSEMTHEQIAEQRGEPLGTVKARIRRGLLRMRKVLR